jgi:hypothetical protein
VVFELIVQVPVGSIAELTIPMLWVGDSHCTVVCFQSSSW